MKILKKYYKVIIIVCLFVVAAAGIYTGYFILNLHSAIYEESPDPSENGGGDGGEACKNNTLPNEEKIIEEPVLNILLVGADDSTNGRSDTIMLVRYNQEEDEAALLSIPRDTRVKLPRGGYEKINHAYFYEGVGYLKETVEKFLDINIHRYVKVDFEGFKNIVDIIGGVEMEVKQDMYYPPENIDLSKGKQVLDGDKALQYVRWRGDIEADIGRVRRQQRFLGEMSAEIFSFSLSRLLDTGALAGEVAENVEMDFKISEIISFLPSIYGFKWEEVETKTLPGENAKIDDIWYWEVDKEKARNTVDEII